MRSPFTAFTIAFMLLALSACGSTYVPKQPQVQVIHRAYSIVFNPADGALSPEEQQRMEIFFAGINPQSAQAIRILVRNDSPDNLTVGARLKEWLLMHGYLPGTVSVLPVAQQQEAVMVLADYVTALPPAGCPNWSDGMTNYRNATWANFGCADATNLSQQVENPGDLVRGSGAAALDGDRNQVAITNYKTDKVTQTVKESASTTSGSQ